MKEVAVMGVTLEMMQVALTVEQMAVSRAAKMVASLTLGLELVKQLVLEKMMAVQSVFE